MQFLLAPNQKEDLYAMPGFLSSGPMARRLTSYSDWQRAFAIRIAAETETHWIEGNEAEGSSDRCILAWRHQKGIAVHCHIHA